jgi:hypothetical protein
MKALTLHRFCSSPSNLAKTYRAIAVLRPFFGQLQRQRLWTGVLCIQELDNNIPVIRVRTALYIYLSSVEIYTVGMQYFAAYIAIVFQCVNRNSLVDHKRIRALQNYINLKCNTCTCIHTKLITLAKCVLNMLLLYMVLVSLTNVTVAI